MISGPFLCRMLMPLLHPVSPTQLPDAQCPESSTAPANSAAQLTLSLELAQPQQVLEDVPWKFFFTSLLG